MPPVIVLVRHGEAQHNLTNKSLPRACLRKLSLTTYSAQDYKLHDPLLTSTGHDQCAKLNLHLTSEEPLTKEIEVVICSPMKRTIQTMEEGLECVIGREGVTVEMNALWQENSDAPCDTGSPISTLQEEFPQWSNALSLVDSQWPSKSGVYAFTRTATLGRGQAGLRSLYSRPERVIAVVSHSGFLRTAVSQSHYANADYRVFRFAEKIAGKDFQLLEDETTKERGGGLGWSWRGWANLEESDFPTEEINEAREETPPPEVPEAFRRNHGRI